MDITVLFDGTWNDTHVNTNINQIHDRLIADGHTEQDCCYVPGVGTQPLERLSGGIAGLGLDRNIRRGYEFIAERRESDADRIFLIGYSRGAFTARSLAGMIAKCGIVKPQRMSTREVFDRYRDKSAPGLREMQNDHRLAVTRTDKKILAESRLVRIRFIGVFDTVGSLGIPGTIGHDLSRRLYEFHDTNLSGLVDFAYHAVAIDEHRKHFVPTLWQDIPKPIPGNPTTLEQRWFVGAHANVGGGGTTRPEVRNPLSVLTREWMIDRAALAGLKITPMRPPESAWQGAIDRSWPWHLLELIPGNGPRLRPLRRNRTTTLDDAAINRWSWGNPRYEPRNPGLAEWVAQRRR